MCKEQGFVNKLVLYDYHILASFPVSLLSLLKKNMANLYQIYYVLERKTGGAGGPRELLPIMGSLS